MHRLPRSVLLAALALAACRPIQAVPIQPDAMPDGSCAVSERITEDRLIRTATGSPLVILCDAGVP